MLANRFREHRRHLVFRYSRYYRPVLYWLSLYADDTSIPRAWVSYDCVSLEMFILIVFIHKHSRTLPSSPMAQSENQSHNK